MLCGWLPTRIFKEEKLNAKTALLINYLPEPHFQLTICNAR